MDSSLKKITELSPLKGFDTLSHDAQKVMLSLQRKYSKMREQIIETQMKKELLSQDPSEYYRSLYSRQFKSDPYPRQSPFSNRSQRNSGHADSVDNFSYQNQHCHNSLDSKELQLPGSNPVRIKQEPQSPFPVQTSEFHRHQARMEVSVGTDQEFSFQVPGLINPYNKERRNSTSGRNDDSAFAELHSRTVQNSKRLQETPNMATKQRKVSNELRMNINEQCQTDLEFVFEPRMANQPLNIPILQTNTQTDTSFNLGFSLEGCEVVSVGESCNEISDIEKDAFEASQDLFALTQELEINYTVDVNFPESTSVRHQTERKRVLTGEHDEIDIFPNHLNPQLNFHTNMLGHSEKKSFYPERSLREEVDKDYQGQFQEKQNHSRELFQELNPENEELKVPASRKAQSCIDNFFQKPSCSIARKLEFNKTIRTMDESTTPSVQVAGKEGNGQVGKQIPKFGKPNKSKKDQRKMTSAEGQKQKEMTPAPSYYDVGLVEVMSLSKTELEGIRDSLLQSRTVCLTLLYSDESTLFRNFQPTQAKISSIVVKAFGKPQSRATNMLSSTLLFDCHGHDEHFQNWFKCLMKELMNNTNIEKIAMNAKQFFIKLFELCDEKDQGTTSWKILDPMIGAWLLNSDKPPRCFQDVLKESGLRRMITVTQGGLRSLDLDLSLLQELMSSMRHRLETQGLWELFSRVETRLVPVLARLEKQRLLVDTSTLNKFASVLKKKLTKLEEKAFASVGHSFCINSHPQLRQVLYEELRLDEKLPAKSKIAKTSVAHQKSTSEATLTQLRDTHALPALVLEYRQLQKLKSTYVDGMLSCVRGGYLSTHWDQTAAATGRLTSSQPNIQAIPKVPVIISEFENNFIVGKADESVDIYAREPFISHEGYVLLAADFQQIELRLLAHLADDPVLLNIFNDENVQDIFIELTSQWLGKPVSSISPTEREQTKRIVYSVMYGVGKEKLAEYLKVSPVNAKAIMTSFLVKFPVVNSFTKTCFEFCQKKGFTRTIFGRKRLIPHISHPSFQLRAQASRQAVNFCLQGSAADLCKAAMLCVQDQLENNSLANRTRLLAQIHDELLWEVEEEYLEAVKGLVKRVMEDSSALCGDMLHLMVPIRVSLSVGRSWAHLNNC